MAKTKNSKVPAHLNIGSEGSKMTPGDKAFEICLGAFFILASILVLIPIVNVIATSFSSKGAILAGKVGLLPVEFTLEAYTRTLSNSGFTNSFLYSILLTAGYTLLAMIATILCAYPLARSNLKGRKVIMALIVFTMYFDPGIIPNYLNVKSFGLLDTFWSLIIPCLLTAYNMIIMRTFFMGIDNALYEAAYIDGCNEFQTLWKVILPLCGPAIATLSLFYAVSRWNGVSDVMFYVNDPQFFTVQMKLKQMIDNIQIASLEPGSTAALALTPENIKAASIMISMLPMLIAYPFVQKYFTKGIMLGSVKG